MKNQFLTQISNQQQMQVNGGHTISPEITRGKKQEAPAVIRSPEEVFGEPAADNKPKQNAMGDNKADLEKLYTQLQGVLGEEGQKNYVKTDEKGNKTYNPRDFRTYVESYIEENPEVHQWIKDQANADIDTDKLLDTFVEKHTETVNALNAMIDAEIKAKNKETYNNIQNQKEVVAKVLLEGKKLTEESAVSYSKALLVQAQVDDETPDITTGAEFEKIQEEAIKVGATLKKSIENAQTNEGSVEISVGDTTSKVKGIKFGGK